MLEGVVVLLVISFGVFAMAMLIVLFVYLKGSYNCSRIEEDYKKDLDQDDIEEEEIEENIVIETKQMPAYEVEEDMVFVPKKKE